MPTAARVPATASPRVANDVPAGAVEQAESKDFDGPDPARLPLSRPESAKDVSNHSPLIRRVGSFAEDFSDEDEELDLEAEKARVLARAQAKAREEEQQRMQAAASKAAAASAGR